MHRNFPIGIDACHQRELITVKTPHIHSLIGTTIKMDRIEFDLNLKAKNLGPKIYEVLKGFATTRPYYICTPDSYIEGITEHMFTLNNKSLAGEDAYQSFIKFNDIFATVVDDLNIKN